MLSPGQHIINVIATDFVILALLTNHYTPHCQYMLLFWKEPKKWDRLISVLQNVVKS